MRIRIYGAKTIADYRAKRDAAVQKWIDDNFAPGCVTWGWISATKIRITDGSGDTMDMDTDTDD